MTEADTASVDKTRERIEKLHSIGCADYIHLALLTERDLYKARAERAEEALKPFADVAKHHAADAPEWRPFDSVSVQIPIMALKEAMATLAQIDAEPAEPRQPTVQEAARVLLGGSESPLLVALDPFNNSVDVAEDVLAALRALAEGDNQ